jgi:hypothetical protein
MGLVSGTLGGIPLLMSSNFGWTIRSGVRPEIREFDIMLDSENALKGKIGKPIELVIKGRSDTLTVKGLYVLHVGPGENPNIRRVTVADRRWMWPMCHILRRVNIRRRVGFKRLAAPNLPPELEDVAPKLWYAPYSIKDEDAEDAEEARWKLKDIFEDVLKEMKEFESEFSGASFSYSISSSIDGQKSLPIEQAEIDDTSDAALQRLLGYAAAGEVGLDKDGNVTIFSRADGGEGAEVDKLGPPIWGRGTIIPTDFSALRPSKITFLFTPEIEMRLKFEERGSATTTIQDDKKALVVHNVIPIPDYQATIGGVEVCQGTYVRMEQYLAYLNSLGVPGTLGRLDFDILNKAMVPWNDLWGALGLAGSSSPNGDWSARIAAIQHHYRKTFRVERTVMDRLLDIRAYRVATIDPQSGQRAPAICYSDYAIIPSTRALFAQATSGADLSAVLNVVGWPVDGRIDTETRPAPATVSILDKDQGVIHVEYQIDPNRMAEQVLPSMIEINGDLGVAGLLPSRCGPSLDLTQAGRAHAFNAVLNSEEWAKLTNSHRAMFILTAIPAAPNTDKQLFRVEIKPDDVKDLLGGISIGSCKGPEMEIRIGAGVETARVAWQDEREEDIRDALGLNGNDKEPEIEDLVINHKKSGEDVGASLLAISKAKAAAYWGALADRKTGVHVADMKSTVKPAGNIRGVEHEVSTDGETVTRLELPGEGVHVNLFSLLDNSARRAIMRLVT